MNSICEDIQQWQNRAENDSPEKRALLLSKICRLFYCATVTSNVGHISAEQQGVARIFESAIEHRFCVFIDTRSQSPPADTPSILHIEK